MQVIKVSELHVMNMMGELIKKLPYPPSKKEVEKAKHKYILIASLLN